MDHHLNENQTLLNRLFRIGEKNSFNCYIEARGDRIDEESEEEEDTVEPLFDNPNGKYNDLMAGTRERKWGLVQRTDYEAKRTNSLINSRQTGISSRITLAPSEGKATADSSNKVTVNEKLKSLLFG